MMPEQTTPDEESMATDEIYGQVHPKETPTFVVAKLRDLEAEIERLTDKDGLQRAQEKCPHLVDTLKLACLRCEVFDAERAAKRLAKYWDQRILIFGESRAFLPLTQEGALRDDRVALGRGFLRFCGRDSGGRAVILIDPSKQNKSKYSRESMVRACWYMLSAALEDEAAQQKGVVFLSANPPSASLSEFDPKLIQLVTNSVKGCIPVRVSAIHICQPPPFLAFIFPVIKLALGQRLRKRIKLHTSKRVDLSKYGLSVDATPSDVGGTLTLDHEKWLKQREKVGGIF